MAMSVTWHGPAVQANERKGAAKGLLEGAQHVLERSQELVPVASSEYANAGVLQASGVVSIDEGALRAAVSYGPWFSVPVHERMELHHEDGRTSKYLETPLNSESGKVWELVAAAIKAEIGS